MSALTLPGLAETLFAATATLGGTLTYFTGAIGSTLSSFTAPIATRFGRPPFAVDIGEGPRIQAEERDLIVLAESLLINGSAIRPANGAQIALWPSTIGANFSSGQSLTLGQTLVYEVMDPPYSAAGGRALFRIHSRLVQVA